MEYIIPESIQDTSNKAIEECIINALENIDYTKFTVTIPENLNENVLPYIAEQRHILGNEGWNSALTKEEKCGVIHKSFSLHRKKGTLGAINDILKIYNASIEYINWTEYNGIPHHYKIVLSIENENFDTTKIKEMLSKIKEYKQLRAKQDTFETVNSMHTPLYISERINQTIITSSLPQD